MNKFLTIVGILLTLSFFIGCTTRYPWYGPLVDPNGKPPPEPSYVTP